MRKLIIPTLAVLAIAAVNPGSARAQEVGQKLTLRGCLAQENDDGETEYVLQGISGADISATEIDLVPAEGVDVSEHVGHTVEVTGAVVAESDKAAEEGMEEEAEAESEDAETGVALQVTNLTHIAASCSEGSGG